MRTWARRCVWIGWLGALAVLPLEAAERDSLNGTWIAESAELGGQPFPEEIRKSFRLTLKICYDLSGKARPIEFQSTAANQQLLVVYRREKK